MTGFFHITATVTSDTHFPSFTSKAVWQKLYVHTCWHLQCLCSFRKTFNILSYLVHYLYLSLGWKKTEDSSRKYKKSQSLSLNTTIVVVFKTNKHLLLKAHTGFDWALKYHVCKQNISLLNRKETYFMPLKRKMLTA